MITRNKHFMLACEANSEFSGPSSLSDLAASSILSDDAFLESYIKTNQRRLAQNYELATGFLKSHDIPYKEGSNAGLYVWADLFAPDRSSIEASTNERKNAGASSKEALKSLEAKMTDILLDHKIFLASGSDFGTDVSGWFRVVFAHEKGYLLEGLERMVRAVKAFSVELEKK